VHGGGGGDADGPAPRAATAKAAGGAREFKVLDMNNDGIKDTYRIKAQPAVTPPVEDTAPPTEENLIKYAWSVRSHYYYDLDCSAVKRISKANLQTGANPPADKEHFVCSGK